MASIDPFNRLVKLAARAFYDDISTKGENQAKAGKSDNRGIAVVILDALTRRQWVREEDLAKDLKLHTKQLRRALRLFEEEKLVTRDHRKESSKGAKIYNAAVAATVDGHVTGREGDEKLKMHTQSYCCLDYAQIYDVVRYRIHRMRKKLKDGLESRNTIQEYACPSCSRRYTALDALRLISPSDEYFHCERCDSILVAESDQLGGQELRDGDDNSSRRHHDKVKTMLNKMEEQLKPLMDQIARVKDLPAPEFGSLQAWELRANAAGRVTSGDFNSNDPSKSLHGTPMPYVGETKVEVAFSGSGDGGEDVKPNTNEPMKVLPPWMIKQGMVLTKEQRGETKPELNMGSTSKSSAHSDDKKSTVVNEDSKTIQDEYYKAYYAALLKRQQEAVKQEQGLPNNPIDTNSQRQVGMKSKREDDDEDDDVWEEGSSIGNTSAAQFKVNDLNVEAAASGDDEDENDWEDG
ncbi:transcription factor efuD-like [Andrographis paniculata]|uniref:transcription factor efuD-like n=1 Tax=Andrographis paniculata TaxID=175694 RepID=UPI0021E6F7EF|nr:transcription factor efuD-like [Andrographis paniculata]